MIKLPTDSSADREMMHIEQKEEQNSRTKATLPGTFRKTKRFYEYMGGMEKVIFATLGYKAQC